MEAFKPLQSIKCCALQRATPYCPYGHRKSEGHLTTWLGFNGEPQDRQSEYYMLGRGYRAYNPRLLRFLSPDSLSPFGKGGINSYAYCAGDPVNFADPSGHLAPPKRIAQTRRATSSRRPSLTSAFERLAQQQETTEAADLIAQTERALTLQRELTQRAQPRPQEVIGSAEATPYASMESLQSSENSSLTDLPSAIQQSVQTTTPNTTEVTDIRMQAHELRANSPSRRRASI
ncbi:RHS repeat-associated core domain-containing protein [Pseudomonas sp. LPD2]|uniref:RHS repeat-associated core domain-containing protein n=1 Tax=Pseudomonas sp. LPB4.O TaxID=3135254 RepID=UPI003251A48D